jgi:hypothetical protein
MRGAAASVGAAVLGGMVGAAGTAGLALVGIMAVGLALAADPTEEVGQAVAGMRVVGIPAEDMGAEDMGAEDTGVEDMAVAATVIASASYRPQRSCAGAVLRPERWFRLP